LKNDADQSGLMRRLQPHSTQTPLRVVGNFQHHITLTTNGTAAATNSQAFNTGMQN